MDKTAFTLLEENRVPVVVFDIEEENIIERILKGEKKGTIIR
jgi:uridylate kinase